MKDYYIFIIIAVLFVMLLIKILYDFAFTRGYAEGIDHAIAYFEYMTEEEIDKDHLKGGV